MLVGTWAAAEWAIRFYRRHGFQLVAPERTATLLKAYWTIADRQIATSVVLANPRFAEEQVTRPAPRYRRRPAPRAKHQVDADAAVATGAGHERPRSTGSRRPSRAPAERTPRQRRFWASYVTTLPP